MRIVAVALAALSMLALTPPAASSDECADPGSGSFCREIELARPGTPPNFPSVPQTPYWGTYYLWLGAGHCTASPTAVFSGDCTGQPATGPVGVELPDGGMVPSLGTMGILYEETNGRDGLQRTFTTRPADRMVLV